MLTYSVNIDFIKTPAISLWHSALLCLFKLMFSFFKLFESILLRFVVEKLFRYWLLWLMRGLWKVEYVVEDIIDIVLVMVSGPYGTCCRMLGWIAVLSIETRPSYHCPNISIGLSWDFLCPKCQDRVEWWCILFHEKNGMAFCYEI